MLVPNLLSVPFSGLFLLPFLMLLNRPLDLYGIIGSIWWDPGRQFNRPGPLFGPVLGPLFGPLFIPFCVLLT